ncbi:MAG: hypothetical protein GY777_30970 [Candidatus Brocadiaceae bacterium]|nr:hypothetical protein [Candidatus Brocadiaceae bacterium]
MFLYKRHLNLLITDDNENPLQSPFRKGGEKSELEEDGNIEMNNSVLNYAFVAIGTFLILTPTMHPWYLTWIVPFLCFNKNRAWLILTGTVVCYYFMNHELFSKMIWYNNEWVWKEVHWLKLPEYLPFYGLLIYGWLKQAQVLNFCRSVKTS